MKLNISKINTLSEIKPLTLNQQSKVKGGKEDFMVIVDIIDG